MDIFDTKSDRDLGMGCHQCDDGTPEAISCEMVITMATQVMHVTLISQVCC